MSIVFGKEVFPEPEYSAPFEAMDVLDETGKVYLEACNAYNDCPSEDNLDNLVKIANVYANSYTVAICAMMEDASINEFAKLSSRLLLSHDAKRVAHINQILDQEVLYELPDRFRFLDDDEPVDNEEVVRGVNQQLAEVCISLFGAALESDTEKLVEEVADRY